MADAGPEGIVAALVRPIVDVDVPLVLRASIERQIRSLVGLAASLLSSGIDEQKVRDVIEKASASYRDELIAATLELRKSYAK